MYIAVNRTQLSYMSIRVLVVLRLLIAGQIRSPEMPLFSCTKVMLYSCALSLEEGRSEVISTGELLFQDFLSIDII